MAARKQRPQEERPAQPAQPTLTVTLTVTLTPSWQLEGTFVVTTALQGEGDYELIAQLAAHEAVLRPGVAAFAEAVREALAAERVGPSGTPDGPSRVEVFEVGRTVGRA